MTKTFTLARTASLALIATGFFALAPLAHAADEDQLPQGELNIAGTDFASPKAVDHLIARLHRVAMDICTPNSDQNTVLSNDQRTCIQTAVKSGMAQIEVKRQQAMRETAARVATATPVASPVH